MIVRLRASFLFCILVIGLLFRPAAMFAQAIQNSDSLFQKAQQLAREGNYERSRRLARQVIQEVPDFTDATVLIGRTYAWESKYDSARAVLLPHVEVLPAPAEVLLALTDIELWSKNPLASLRYASLGQAQYPNVVSFDLAKARALRDLHRYREAIQALKAVNVPDNHKVEELLTQLYGSLGNRLRADYRFSYQTDDAPSWQLGSIEYTRLSPKGNFIAKINYADRFEREGVQGELEAYPRLGEKAYAYVGLGASSGMLFPSYRGGAEFYYLLPRQMEVSLGTRALFYPEETVLLYTGHFGIYFSRYWVAFRPFLQQQRNQWKTTATLQLRRYFKHADEFLSLKLVKGSTPFTQVTIEEMRRLNASGIGLEGQLRLGQRFLLGSSFLFEYEEYRPSSYRSRYTTGISVDYKF